MSTRKTNGSAPTFAALLVLIAAVGTACAAPPEDHAVEGEDPGDYLPLQPHAAIDGLTAISIVWGQYPDYEGSSDHRSGVAPAFRRDFSGTTRYLQLLGPELSFNALDHPKWAAGPLVQYRFGRDGDIDNPVVASMTKIDDTFELGGFVSWRKVDPEEIRNRLSLRAEMRADIGGVYDSYLASVSAMFVRRLALPVDLIGNAGVSFAGKGYMDTYFSITPRNVGDAALPYYRAHAGGRDVRAGLALMLHFSRAWHLGVGGQYRRLLSEPANSPLVRECGDANQWLAGTALIYAW
ncbi:MipA/OmpV family protein [Stenotrophomonas sepilia]